NIEQIELGLEEGLALPYSQAMSLEIEFELNDLLRMDTSTKVKSWGDLVKAGIATPNEAREKFNMGPVAGGYSPYLQQQNYSLAPPNKRDSAADPFATAQPSSHGASGSPPPGAGDGDGGGAAAASTAATAADRAMAKMIREQFLGRL